MKAMRMGERANQRDGERVFSTRRSTSKLLASQFLPSRITNHESRVTNYELRITNTAFTLLELLAVMAIIAVLAGLVVGLGRYASYRKKVAITQATIKVMESALRDYRSDNGTFPTNTTSAYTLTDATNNSKILFKALSGNTGGTNLAPDKAKAYFTAFRQGAGGNVAIDGGVYFFVDPWGQPYNYITPGKTNVVTYDLGSAGPDGAFTNANAVWNYKF